MTTALWYTPTQEAEAKRVVSSRLPQVHKKTSVSKPTSRSTTKMCRENQTNKNTVI